MPSGPCGLPFCSFNRPCQRSLGAHLHEMSTILGRSRNIPIRVDAIGITPKGYVFRPESPLGKVREKRVWPLSRLQVGNSPSLNLHAPDGSVEQR